MKKADKYRFSLQFGADTEEKIQAGEFLERLGNKKSSFIVEVVSAYLENHPGVHNGTASVQVVRKTSISMERLEETVRELIGRQMEEIKQTMAVSDIAAESKTETEITEDAVAAMVSNLDLFDKGF